MANGVPAHLRDASLLLVSDDSAKYRPSTFGELSTGQPRELASFLSSLKELQLELGREETAQREVGLHPSDLSKSDWCPRAAFWLLSGKTKLREDEQTSFIRQQIFEEGHDIHQRWQWLLWRMGVLEGEWKCLACESQWWATAPLRCDVCGAPSYALTYHEVPASVPELHITGRADGKMGRRLFEFKSLGAGTIRFEAPELLRKYTYDAKVGENTYKWQDLEGLWKNFHSPLPSHLIQANLYLYARDDVDEVVFVYQAKWNQQVKFFPVKYSYNLIKERLSQVRQVNDALSAGEPPDCVAPGKCQRCSLYEDEDGQDNPGSTSKKPRSKESSKRPKKLVRASGATKHTLAYVAKKAHGGH